MKPLVCGYGRLLLLCLCDEKHVFKLTPILFNLIVFHDACISRSSTKTAFGFLNLP